MLVLVAIAFAGPMVLKKPDGTPFLESPWDLFSVDSKVPSSIGSGINSSQSFYKWQDENGTWHYSDQPQEGQNIETVTVNTNANLIQGLRAEKEEIIEGPTNEIDVQKDSASMPLPMTVPFEEVPKMLEDVSNLQQVMDDRKKAIDNATQSR